MFIIEHLRKLSLTCGNLYYHDGWDFFESRFFIILAVLSVVTTILAKDASVQ